MNLLIRQVIIADPASSYNDRRCDILVENGLYKEISNSIEPSGLSSDVKIIEANGLYLSPGWFDMHANFREPGEEQKETIRSGQSASAQGGFTGVLMMPSTKVNIQSKAEIEYIIGKAKDHAVNVYPSGCLTVNREGKDLNELYDMQSGGALAFTDDKRAVADSGVMLRALQYSGNINAKLIAFADDKSISGKGIANESANTTMLGFKGSPDIAEEIDLKRLFTLMEYSDQPLHISGISSRKGVEAIKEAKAKGLSVTADVYAHQLLLSDEMLDGFDTNYKVKPPLRSADDKLALKEAVLNGIIDAVASDHSPEDPESKVLEFDYSAFGIISLETAYAVIQTALGDDANPEIIAKILSIQPRKILGLPAVTIKQGEKANFTLFDPAENWLFEAKHIRSLSRNTPFIGYGFRGKVKGIYNNSIFVEAVE